MGHRQMLNAVQTIETEADQAWNHGEHPCITSVSFAAESTSISHPTDSIATPGGHFHSQWAHASSSSGYSSPVGNDEVQRYQLMSIGLQRDLIPHQSTPGVIHVPQEKYLHHPSSSNADSHSVPGTDGSFYDGRGSYKRKIPCIALTCDKPSASRCCDVGSSSDRTSSGEKWQEKHSSHHSHREYPPNYSAVGLSIGEGTQRNIRPRVSVEPGTNPPWTPLPSCSADQSNAPREWDNTLMAPPPRAISSGSDPSFTIPFPSSHNLLNSHSNSGSTGIGGCSNDITTNRNHVSQNALINQSISASRNGYVQRSVPTFIARSSSNRPGHISTTVEHHTVAENQPSRARVFSNLRLQNMYRNGRISMSGDIYRYYPTGDASFPNRFMSENLMFLNQPAAFYGSRALFDQHRDMRLDTDNMTYEELLALGDRIGTVNIGLSKSSISKCLTASIFCSSECGQDEGSCVICLEEYKNMDDVGSLKGCGHDFHVGCIRKWLSIKNLCPICKATAMDDDTETIKRK